MRLHVRRQKDQRPENNNTEFTLPGEARQGPSQGGGAVCYGCAALSGAANGPWGLVVAYLTPQVEDENRETRDKSLLGNATEDARSAIYVARMYWGYKVSMNESVELCVEQL